MIRSAITAVEQPDAASTGRLLAELTLAQLDGKPSGALQRLHQPVLVAGESDGPAQR